MCELSMKETAQFYEVHRQQPFFSRLVEFMTSGRTVAIELLAEGDLLIYVVEHIAVHAFSRSNT